MDKIAYISRIFRLLLQIFFIFIPLFTVSRWVMLPASGIVSGGNNMHFYYYNNPIPSGLQLNYTITFSVKILGFVANMLTVSALMLILHFLIKLFRNYEHKNIFSLKNVRVIRNVGYTLIVWQILIPIKQALLSIILTWRNGPGERILSANFNGDNITVILIAFIVILISSIMAEGHKLQKEQEYTV